MVSDKRKSKQKNVWRISEKKLLTTGWAFGSLGISLGMLPPVNHKKRKNWFRYGMPIAAIIHILILYKIYTFAAITFNLYWKSPF